MGTKFTRKGVSMITAAVARNEGTGVFTERNLPRMVIAAVDLIDPNPDQPRRHFDDAELQELASSIEAKGLIQPIVVVQNPDGRYTLVVGERRLRAHKLLGRNTINAITLPSGSGADELALIENIQRVDLTALDEARAYRQLMDRHDYDQNTLATVVGRNKSTVSRTLRINNLPKPILDDIEQNNITIPKTKLFELVDIEDPEICFKAWQSIKQGARVSDLRAAKQGKPPNPTAAPPPPSPATLTKTIKTVHKHVDALTTASPHFDDTQRNALLELRQKIDTLLSGA
jgi:ParB family transcriptional regulator, chromosome partitioning protein